MVNRWWMELFGNGLVTTQEEFGLQGEFPSHPELLDWLAVEFMERGWSVKHSSGKMVLSAPISKVPSSHPNTCNTTLRTVPRRGPRHRLDAELLRDNALAIAGLLRHEVGGKPAFATPSAAEKAEAGAGFTWRRGIYLRSQQRGERTPPSPASTRPIVSPVARSRPRTNTPSKRSPAERTHLHHAATHPGAAREPGTPRRGLSPPGSRGCFRSPSPASPAR